MNLEWISLGRNSIIDISGLSTLINLRYVSLESNQIADISGLSTLINLSWVNLEWNQIADIYPLIQNSGIGNWDTVNLSDNPLSETSINTYIPQLEARGVTVNY